MKRKFGFWLVLSVFSLLLSACVSERYPATAYQSPPNHLAATVKKYKLVAETRLHPYFKRAGVAYPPAHVALLAFKEEKQMELWARNANQRWVFIRSYPILAAAGSPGPKLHEGDDQVPEGIYHIVQLNPYSHYHLSMGLNYPNNFDRLEALQDRRSNLGNNIFIHGSDLSIGCIAMGDRTIEELFVLAYEAGLPNTEVIIAPNDLRHKPPVTNARRVAWLPQLYSQLRSILANFS